LRGVGACCALCVKAMFIHCGQPGHNARTCPLSRQGSAAAAHPHACFSKGCSSTVSCTPLQRLWGSKAHTQTCTHTHTHACPHTHTHTHIHTHAHTHTITNTREYTQVRARTYTCTRTNTQTHARAHIHTHKHRHTRTHTRAHTHIHICIYMHACIARVMGFANFPALLATLPHLSCARCPLPLFCLHFFASPSHMSPPHLK